MVTVYMRVVRHGVLLLLLPNFQRSSGFSMIKEIITSMYLFPNGEVGLPKKFSLYSGENKTRSMDSYKAATSKSQTGSI